MTRTKTTGKEGVSLSIPKSKVPLAINLLHSHGYPEEHYTNVNEVFSDSGLVTTDFERKVRFNYALSQEISETLSKIDGVLFVKVHLSIIDEEKKKQVQPGRKPEREKLSAAVFVKYNSEHNLDSEIPKIKATGIQQREQPGLPGCVGFAVTLAREERF